MFIIEERDSIEVYDKGGRLVYKSLDVVQYKKFNEESLAVITEESIDFVSEVKRGLEYDITVASDTNFTKAVIYNEYVLIERKIIFPILDVYNSDFINMIRLYQNRKGSWIYFITKFGIPLKAFEPVSLKATTVYGKRKSVNCGYNLETKQFTQGKQVGIQGVPLTKVLKQFKVGDSK